VKRHLNFTWIAEARLMIRILIAYFLLVISMGSIARAQSLTISQAVQQAVEKYPAVRASLEQVRAAAEGVNLARTNYLPRADGRWTA